MSRIDNRCCNWAFILYPDSAPVNFDELLRSMMVAGCYSPLHSPSDAKPHYHVVLSYSSKKSYEQVLKAAELFHGTRPEPIHDCRQYVRYLIHADNPDKQQFNESDIITFGGFDVSKYFSATSLQKKAVFADIMAFVRDNPCIYYCDLVNYCIDFQPEWLYMLQTNLAVNKVISEYLYSYRKKLNNIVDK